MSMRALLAATLLAGCLGAADDAAVARQAVECYVFVANGSGVVVDPAGPEALAALLKSDLAKWQKVIAQGRISGD